MEGTVIIFLVICCTVFAQRQQCPRAASLVRSGCTRGCITVTRDSFPCPVCNGDCTDGGDQCMPSNATSCGTNQECLAVGVAGQYACVNRISEGGNCTVRKYSRAAAIRRIRARRQSNFGEGEIVGQLSDSDIMCATGLVCRREVGNRGTCAQEMNGPCIAARNGGQEVECDEDGNFEPLQCTMQPNSTRFTCQCVEPRTGNQLADTETVTVEDENEAPDCEDAAHNRCTYRSSGGVTYVVRSGMTYVDAENCRRCVCRNGSPDLCDRERESCGRVNPTPNQLSNCTLRGNIIPHRGSFNVSCNRCVCRNGKLACTRRACEDEGELPQSERNCHACGRMRSNPVCGSNGRTYPSMCFAVNCSGLQSSALVQGPCSRQSVCERFPCAEGEFCLKMGGVTCLSRSGCDRSRFRRCINPETLTCDGRDEGEEQEEEGVCARDRNTYSSICNLLQSSGSDQVQVAYTGPCNRSECMGREVCGTDGETYANICELRANSANARVEHRGACMTAASDELFVDRCTRIKENGLCSNLSSCETVVRPGDGCCPVCGGAVFIGLDRDGLDEYIELDPSLSTVDELLETLVSSGFITDQVLQRCGIEGSLLETGELHILLENKVSTDNLCYMAVVEIAESINNPQGNTDIGTTTTTTTTAIPQILQFATIAHTAPLVSISEESGNTQPLVSSALALLVLVCTALSL